MSMNDKNGCSTTLAPGREQYEFFTMGGKRLCQYDYRHPNGELFSRVEPTLEACRTFRDDWLVSKECERFELINRCLTRYYILIAPSKNRMRDFMDLEFSRVNVWKLIRWDNANFEHDMIGIFRHIDRENKCLKDGFIPRAGIMEDVER